MKIHGELLNRFAASVLPYQLRSGSMAKDQAGYATVLRQAEQNAAAEEAYKDAIQKADAIPVAEMMKQVQLIKDEMRRTNNNSEYVNFLSGFSQNLEGGKDAEGNEVPGAIKLPITARKDLIEFYIRPSMQADGTAVMSSPAKDGTVRFIPDANVVFKPEEAKNLADQVTSKYKELYNIDLGKDPAKDAEFQVLKRQSKSIFRMPLPRNAQTGRTPGTAPYPTSQRWVLVWWAPRFFPDWGQGD